MFGLSKRFIFSFLGVILITFAVLYGVHKATGTGPKETEVSEQGDTRSARRSVERNSSSGSRGSLSSGRDDQVVVARSEDEQIIMDVADSARLEVTEQQRVRREQMAPLMEKRREFFASLEAVEDEQERNRLRAEWMETQRAEIVELRNTQDTESARASQNLASLGSKLQRLRRYDLVPELKPQANEIRTLMAKYAREHENSDISGNPALWTQIEQSIQELRMQHQKLMHPERFR